MDLKDIPKKNILEKPYKDDNGYFVIPLINNKEFSKYYLSFTDSDKLYKISARFYILRKEKEKINSETFPDCVKKIKAIKRKLLKKYIFDEIWDLPGKQIVKEYSSYWLYYHNYEKKTSLNDTVIQAIHQVEVPNMSNSTKK